MKNQYVADINDYNKYLLLQELSSEYRVIDVCWMLTDNDDRKDGRKISYLFDESKRQDTAIYDYLKNLVTDGISDVRAIEQSNIIPVRKYYNSIFDFDYSDMPDLLFFDPDNGLETKSVKYGSFQSRKYVFYRDLYWIIHRNTDVLIYQHYPRVNRIKYQNMRTEEIKSRFSDVEVKHFDRGMVDFILIHNHLPDPYRRGEG